MKQWRLERMKTVNPNGHKAHVNSVKLKKNPTKAEMFLRKHLLKNGVKFQFQKYFYSLKGAQCFIVDFYLNHYKSHLAIEIDGGYHFTDRQKRYDRYRQTWLERNRKCTFLRFTNEEVFNNVDLVVRQILDKKKSFLIEHIERNPNDLIAKQRLVTEYPGA